jgi:DNA-binding YbaB/EbfC family protein
MDFLKNMGNMGEMMKQAAQMKGHFDRVKEEARSEEINIEQQGISIILNGLGEVSKVTVDPSLLSPDRKAELEAGFQQAINQATERVKGNFKSKVAGLTGGMF